MIEARSHATESERSAQRRADAWLEAERIEAYLPVLGRQREQAAARLAELDELIRDEQRAIVELRAVAEPEKARAEAA
jgi:hypothetical protein